MKIFVAFIFLPVFFLLSCTAPTQNTPPTTNQKSSTPSPKIEAKGSISDREKFVENLKSSMAKEGLTMELSGENKDVLNIKSSKISNYNLLQDFKDLFEDLRKGGFREINFTDSTGERRNVNLTVLD